jgi:molybdopterin-guanine dinucleotide biosynthesis protein
MSDDEECDATTKVTRKKSMKKIKGMEIVPPKHESGQYKTSPNLPKMHQVCIAVGKRASGKTTAVVNLIEKMNFDYVIAVSPTLNSNKEIMSRLKVEHIFEDTDDTAIVDNIKNIINQEARDLETYLEDLKKYNKLMKDIKSGKYMGNDDLLLQFFNDEDNMFLKPTHRWNGEKPRIAVLIDDAMGSLLYQKPRKLNNLATLSRHTGQLADGGSIGCSLFFLIQSFKAQAGGLSKVIRNQATSMILFKTKDQNELEDVYESVAGEIDKDTFYKIYDKAIGEGNNYEFLFIDFHPKEGQSMFRQRFDVFLFPETL